VFSLFCFVFCFFFCFLFCLFVFLFFVVHLVMMTESSGNVKSVIFWVHLIFCLIGVSFNIIFIWIIKKTQKRRDQSGVILIRNTFNIRRSHMNVPSRKSSMVSEV
jgi:uncharacterized membrane protein